MTVNVNPGATAQPLLEPDQAQLATFVHALFKHAGLNGFVSIRGFELVINQKHPNGKDEPWQIHAVSLIGGLQGIINDAIDYAARAANYFRPVVFCPPIAVFSSKTSATENDIGLGLVITVDFDRAPKKGLAKLIKLLGPPTVLVLSGGEWTDPETGEIQPKFHGHWRLNKPANGVDALGKLKEARLLCAQIVDGDTALAPISQPIRWPGSWHRKSEPRLCKILNLNEAIEVDLDETLETLQQFAPKVAPPPLPAPPKPSESWSHEAAAKLRNALEFLGNKADYATYLKYGAAIHQLGWGGIGRDIWDEWSKLSPKYNDANQEKKWRSFDKPYKGRRATVASIYKDARNAGWTWTASKPVTRKPTETVSQYRVAAEFAVRYAGKFLFDHSLGTWFTWWDSHWKKDDTLFAPCCVKELSFLMAEGDPKLESAAFWKGVETNARTEQAMAVNTDTWNMDPMLLGTPDGTVDLRTGVLRKADPADRINRVTAVAPAERADCPRWHKFLNEATGGDAELQEFLQLWAGYCLTGETSEEVLAFLYGPGGNGKGTYTNTLFGIMGDYAVEASMRTFIDSNFDRHEQELACLFGARLVKASETNAGRRWDEARVKAITGRDRIRANFMRQNSFEYLPTFKLNFLGNTVPSVGHLNEAWRRRFLLIPMTVQPAVVDKDLPKKLREEWPQILRWIIDGAVEWARSGLTRPEKLTTATADYFSKQEVLKDWLEESCIVDIGNKARFEKSTDLFQSYNDHRVKVGEPREGIRQFHDEMEAFGFERREQIKAIGTKGYYGITLKASPAWAPT